MKVCTAALTTIVLGEEREEESTGAAKDCGE